jgi:putative transposase
LKRSWGGEVRNVSLLVAIGVNDEGFRKVLAVAEGAKEDKASWTTFLRHLKERGLQGVRLFVSDKCLGLVESLGSFIRKRCGSGARCIFTATCGRQCPRAR